MVDLFMEAGQNYFDTAYVYDSGESERAAKDAGTAADCIACGQCERGSAIKFFFRPDYTLHGEPLPITYVHGKTTNYSLGPKAYALYGSLVIYLVLILYYCLRYWKILDGEKRMAIILAVPLFVITAVIQMMIPETLVVVVCSPLILLGLILSNENTEKYVDEKLLTGGTTVTKYSCMQNIIAFCAETGSRIAYIDYLTNIHNRNALERDLNKPQDRDALYYFIADMNNLKIVNDTMGHSVGD